MPDVAWRFLKTASAALARRHLDLRVTGEHHLPASGPAIIAARHYHHLYDGVAILTTLPRPVHILVGLDWVGNPLGKRAMRALCDAAGWPVVHRNDPRHPGPGPGSTATLRQGTRDALSVLRAGHVLLVFPEGYPTIDPGYTPKQDDDAFLPFEPGVVRLATLAAAGGLDVPIVPAGFHYQRGDRWRVELRFGEPLHVRTRANIPDALAALEQAVHALSQP